MVYRNLDPDTLQEVGKKSIVSYELLEIELDDSTPRFSNGAWDTTYNGASFPSIGNWIAFSDISENTQMQIAEVTISLSGLSNEYFGYFVQTNFIDRPLRIYRQLWNDQDGVVGTFKIFEGRFKNAAVEDDGTNIIVAAVASNQFVDFERIAGRRTNDNEHQFFYPGDLFFEYADEVLKEVKWAPPG